MISSFENFIIFLLSYHASSKAFSVVRLDNIRSKVGYEKIQNVMVILYAASYTNPDRFLVQQYVDIEFK